MNKSLKFYNQFDSKLINDYAYGNKRIISAIENLVRYIPVHSGAQVLDIGCGIGWSTYEFSRFLQQVEFKGVDLSPILINNAQNLFQNGNLNYEVLDITEKIPEQKFDAVVMIDVYEHIPQNQRYKFHKSISTLLNEKGKVILACPSKYHQDFLRKHNPNGLQPIDEDIDLSVLHSLARAIDGEIIYFEFQEIWRPYDYFYAVIQSKMGISVANKLKNNGSFKVEKQKDRLRKLKNQLNIDISLPKKKGIVERGIRKIMNNLK
jgi:2-polyprenyl-3-methyl-5-hydroxy-6-metoxy-1,4-benzoquinol methylase